MDEYHGPALGWLESPFLRLGYLKEGGLRILRLLPVALNCNLLAETPDFGWETPHGWFAILGGHRLWHAPQTEKTAVPETGQIEVRASAGSVDLFRPADPWTRLAKTLHIRLETQRAALTIRHSIRNEGEQAVELAPWGITQLPLGGKAVLPLERSGDAQEGRPVFWPYTRLPDPRLRQTQGGLNFWARPHATELKLGYFNAHGWAGYHWRGVFLRKRFKPLRGLPHADGGCNVEIYCNNHFFELETLGPLVRLAPGETAEHVEVWEVEALAGPAHEQL